MKRLPPIIALLGCLLLTGFNIIQAQQDSVSLQKTMAELEAATPRLPVKGSFKGTYILNTPSVENIGRGVLQVMIMHRFGRLSDGAYQLFGLDNATIRLGLDYGITDRLMIGIGRSSFEKTYDASVKYQLMRQSTDGVIPVSISINGGLSYMTLKFSDKDYLNATYRTSYFTQLLLARKFSSSFTLQLTPSVLHYNLVPETADHNTVLVLGAGGRYKLTKRMSVNAEYNYLFPNQVVSTKVYPSLSAGLDIETGGHVFQFVFSNSQGLVPTNFLGRTVDSWGKGGIYFGFNISRVFNTSRAKSRSW
jgi:opacity protein-like surface antigen